MMLTIRAAWLQKHPTPAASGGEFHWYPAEGDRELRANLAERLRGIDPPAVLWELAPGRVVWAQPFATTAPSDRRRYVGLAVNVVEQDHAAPADLLERMQLSFAGPYTGAVELERQEPGVVPHVARRIDELEPNAIAIARGLLEGSAVRVADPTSPLLLRNVAAIERVLPARGLRRGAWLAGASPVADDLPARLAVAACRAPASREGQAWRVLVELAAARGESLDVVADLVETSACRAIGADLVEVPTSLVGVLHRWGRGHLHGRDLETRLADAVALRALGLLAGGGGPERAIAEARWHALLPAARRTQLLALVARRVPALEEACHA